MDLHPCCRVERKVCFPDSFPVFQLWVLKSLRDFKGLKRACRAPGHMCWQQLCIPAEAGRGQVEAGPEGREGCEHDVYCYGGSQSDFQREFSVCSCSCVCKMSNLNGHSLDSVKLVF